VAQAVAEGQQTPETAQHRESGLAVFDDRLERYHDFWHRRSQFKWPRVRNCTCRRSTGPLTAKTGVRVPLGAPVYQTDKSVVFEQTGLLATFCHSAVSQWPTPEAPTASV
jgi:hypothetical protein